MLLEDAELYRAMPSEEALEAIRSAPTTIEAVAKAFDLYADRACLGERSFVSDGRGGICFIPELHTISYGEVWSRASAFASGLVREGFAKTGDLVGICGFGSTDWVVADLACLYLAAVSVPLQTGMSAADTQQIIRETELACIVCSVEQLGAIEAVLPQCPSVRSIVVMDLREGDRDAEATLARSCFEQPERAPVALHRMSDVERRGREGDLVPTVLPSARREPDPLMTLYYTSGSTGTPKGVMVPESILRRQWHAGSLNRFANVGGTLPHVTVSYMPLNHAAGRFSLIQSIVRGGVTYFVAKSDMSTLFQDIQLARPTSMFFAPRVAEMIYQRFQSEVVRRSSGIANDEERERISEQVMREMGSSFLGDRLLLVITGSAPTPPEVTAFLRRCFEVPVVDGYGSTEAGYITIDDRIAQDVEWRLVDVPELGYRTTDKPYPRGELYVKSPLTMPGYYKNDQATKEVLDGEGFVKTGDIVEQRGPDCLVWIDRAKNILKLSQGEFVATSRLEGLYCSQSPFIRQVFVYGRSMRSYLLAVVVPDLEAAGAYLRARGIEPDDTSVKSLVRSELLRIARDEQLQGYEVPRDFLLEREPFTTENGLLTVSKKPARPKLRARYGERLEALYAEIERVQVEELYGLRGDRGAQSIIEKVKKAVAATVGVTDLDVNQTEQSFLQLGGDSLSAVGLETLLHDICGVRVPVGFLLDPTSSVRAVANYVESALAGRARRAVTFDEVHGVGAKSARAEDLRVEKFLGAGEIESARAAMPRPELPARAQVALLTGANGFLGRFLALELLEQLEGQGTRLYALVRAPSDAIAFERLASTYRTDPALAARFAEAAGNGRLSVLSGDLMKPRFGLSDDAYGRLAKDVDLVVHNGALVNHALGYAQLFEPNVLGTVEVIRLALAGRAKSVAYVSTIGVLGGLQRSEPVREDEDIRTLFIERPTEGGYAAGYSGTKWASELLLRDANEKLGLPVAVFRPSEIMAHSRYHGQINVPDFFTRLVAGIVFSGVAPRSFYTADAPEQAKHYDGEPVDVVARSIAAPSVDRRRGPSSFETFHVVNPHRDDGVSLDLIVGWIRSGGYRVERISDYDAWYRTFHDRLVSLTEPRRHHSPLAILHAWAHPQDAHEVSFDSARLLERLRSISEALAELPHVTEALIHKYLDDLVTLHVIDRPLRMAG